MCGAFPQCGRERVRCCWEEVHVSDREPDYAGLHLFHITMGRGSDSLRAGRHRMWHPPTDVYETDLHVTVKVEVAGVSDEDLTIRLHERRLSISGHRQDPSAKLAYQQMEISYGPFLAEVYLPCDVDESHAAAHVQNGFLYVLLPKAQREHPVPVIVVVERQD
jgi:HSP20 family protein